MRASKTFHRRSSGDGWREGEEESIKGIRQHVEWGWVREGQEEIF